MFSILQMRKIYSYLFRRLDLSKKAIEFNLREKHRLTAFRNIHEGQSCWIIGNGPSLHNTNLLALKDQYTFVVNGITLHGSFKELNPTYYVATNPRLMHSDFLEYDVFPELKENETTCFLNIEAKKRIGITYDKVYYLFTTENPFIGNSRYNLDITKMLLGTRVSVVIQAVIPIAIYMGFKNIYLVGCDSNYNKLHPEKAHFYKDHHTPNLQRLTDYARSRYHDYYSNPDKSMKKYSSDAINEWRIVSTHINRLWIKIFNCTVGGKLEAFPRRRLEDVLILSPNSQIQL